MTSSPSRRLRRAHGETRSSKGPKLARSAGSAQAGDASGTSQMPSIAADTCVPQPVKADHALSGMTYRYRSRRRGSGCARRWCTRLGDTPALVCPLAAAFGRNSSEGILNPRISDLRQSSRHCSGKTGRTVWPFFCPDRRPAPARRHCGSLVSGALQCRPVLTPDGVSCAYQRSWRCGPERSGSPGREPGAGGRPARAAVADGQAMARG